MTLAAWLPLLAVCILGAMSPGPSLAVVLKHSIANSTAHGVAAAVAHGAGVGLYAVFTVAGLSSLLLGSPMLFQGLVYGGAAYLLYMGYKALTSKSGVFQIDSQLQAQTSVLTAARDGFAIAFLNPKLAIFFVALFSQFIDPNNMTVSSGAIMAVTVMVVDGLWYCIVAGVVHQTRDRFALAEKGPLIDKIAGLVFVLLAIRVLTL